MNSLIERREQWNISSSTHLYNTIPCPLFRLRTSFWGSFCCLRHLIIRTCDVWKLGDWVSNWILNGLMMTSSNGNVFRVAGPLCGEGQWRGALIFSLICAWTTGWIKKGDAGDLRRHRAHYGVTVMYQTILRCTLTVITYMGFFKVFHNIKFGTGVNLPLANCIY